MRALTWVLAFLIGFPAARATEAEPVVSASAQEQINEIKKRFPEAEIKVVTPEELNEHNRTVEKAARDTCMGAHKFGEGSFIGPTESQFHSLDSRPRGSYWSGVPSVKDDPVKTILIVIAVIGVVVVAALVIYSVGYLAQALYCGIETLQVVDIGFSGSYIADRSPGQARRGSLAGVRAVASYQVPFALMGLALEVGHLNVDVELLDKGFSRRVAGTYFMTGPRFLFPFRGDPKTGWSLELLAGSAGHREVGLLSTMRFGVDWGLAENFVLGVSAGAALLDLKISEGLVTGYEDLNFIMGTALTLRF